MPAAPRGYARIVFFLLTISFAGVHSLSGDFSFPAARRTGDQKIAASALQEKVEAAEQQSRIPATSYQSWSKGL